MCVLILPTNPQNILLKRTKCLDLCCRRITKRLSIHPTFWVNLLFYILKFKCQWLLGCKIVFTEVAVHYPSFQPGYAGPEKVVSGKLQQHTYPSKSLMHLPFQSEETDTSSNKSVSASGRVHIFSFMYIAFNAFFKIKSCLVKKSNGFLYQKV